MLPEACNFFLTLLQMEEKYRSKLSSESIKIPSIKAIALKRTDVNFYGNGFDKFYHLQIKF